MPAGIAVSPLLTPRKGSGNPESFPRANAVGTCALKAGRGQQAFLSPCSAGSSPPSVHVKGNGNWGVTD